MSGRARLYHWLRFNYAELAQAKADLRYTWRDLAETVADAGARNAFGQRPDAEAVRKAWLKLEADMTTRAAKRPPAPASRTQPSHAVNPDPTNDPPPTDEPRPSRHTFKPAKIR